MDRTKLSSLNATAPKLSDHNADLEFSHRERTYRPFLNRKGKNRELRNFGGRCLENIMRSVWIVERVNSQFYLIHTQFGFSKQLESLRERKGMVKNSEDSQKIGSQEKSAAS